MYIATCYCFAEVKRSSHLVCFCLLSESRRNPYLKVHYHNHKYKCTNQVYLSTTVFTNFLFSCMKQLETFNDSFAGQLFYGWVYVKTSVPELLELYVMPYYYWYIAFAGVLDTLEMDLPYSTKLWNMLRTVNRWAQLLWNWSHTCKPFNSNFVPEEVKHFAGITLLYTKLLWEHQSKCIIPHTRQKTVTYTICYKVTIDVPLYLNELTYNLT